MSSSTPVQSAAAGAGAGLASSYNASGIGQYLEQSPANLDPVLGAFYWVELLVLVIVVLLIINVLPMLGVGDGKIDFAEQGLSTILVEVAVAIIALRGATRKQVPLLQEVGPLVGVDKIPMIPSKV